MKITNNYNMPKTKSPNFKMSFIATEKALAYLNTHIDEKEIEEANKIIEQQQGKKPNIHLHLGNFRRSGNGKIMEYLRATVNNTTFKEGLFTSVFGVLKKSAEYVNSLHKV